MPEPTEFPRMIITNFDVQPGAQFAAEYEVVPLFNRPVSGTFGWYFDNECNGADDIDWQGAQFVRTTEDDVERVRRRLAGLCERANDETIHHIARHQSIEDGNTFVADQQHQADVAPTKGEFRLPFAPTPDF